MQKLIDSDYANDICEIIYYWVESLNISFDEHEWDDVYSLEDLTERIIRKVELPDSDTDTFALTFDRLKRAFAQSGVKRVDTIIPETPLKSLLPWWKRKKMVKQIDIWMKADTGLISPSCFYIFLWIIAGIISIVLLFFHLKIGVLGILLSTSMIYLNIKLGRSLNFQSMQELADDLIFRNYLKMRENKTVNYKELHKLILTSLGETAIMAKEHAKEVRKNITEK